MTTENTDVPKTGLHLLRENIRTLSEAMKSNRGEVFKRYEKFKDDGAKNELLVDLQQVVADLLPDASFAYVGLHIEPLLQEAAELLNRGLADREKWRELGKVQFRLRQELDEFAELDAIHEKEIHAGIYEVSYQAALAEYEESVEKEKATRVAISYAKKILDEYFSGPAKMDYVERSGRYANAAVGPMGKGAPAPDNIAVIQYADIGVHGEFKSREKWAEEAACFFSDIQISIEDSTRLSALSSLQAQAEALREKIKVQGEKKDWEMTNATFKFKRMTVARAMAHRKLAATTEPGNALNFVEQMEPMNNRFFSDFNYAYGRLLAIAPYIKALYGFNAPVPETSLFFHDQATTWARSAINHVKQLAGLEQNCVFPISIRQLIGEAGWATFVGAGRITFNLGETLFQRFAITRLRGVSAFISASTLKGVFSAYLSVPVTGVVFDKTGTRSEFDQSCVAQTFIGRIFRRSADQPADVVGVSTLFNASPIGEWTIEATMNSTAQEALSGVEDLELELHLAYIARSRGFGTSYALTAERNL